MKRKGTRYTDPQHMARDSQAEAAHAWCHRHNLPLTVLKRPIQTDHETEQELRRESRRIYSGNE
jgi:hypothetical protein